MNKLALSILLALPFNSVAQVLITPASGAESICLNPGPSQSDWYSLSDIIITEEVGAEADIESTGGVSKEFILGFSGTGTFVFENAGAASVNVTGANIAAVLDIINSDTEVRVQLQTTAGSLSSVNSFTITGLRIRATAAGSSNIVRTDNLPSSLVITGDDIADAINHGTVTAFNPPVPTLINDKTGDSSNPTICNTETLIFTASIASPANYEFIEIGVPTSLQNGTSNIFITSSLADNDEIAVIATDDNGCSAESVAITVNVNPGFTISLASDAVSNTICDGQNTTFTVTLETGAPVNPITYDFYLNDIMEQTGPSNSYENNALVNQDRVKTIARENIPGSCAATTNTISTSVLPLPNKTLDVNPSSSNICQNESVDFTIVNSELDVKYQLRDYDDDSPLSAELTGNGGDLVITSFALSSSTNVKVVASSLLTANCSVNLTDFNFINVSVITPPLVTFSPANYCVGDAISDPSAIGTDVNWYANFGLTSLFIVSDRNNPPAAELGFSSTAANNKTVYATQTVGGCESAATPIALTVNGNPIADAGIDQTICEGSLVSIGGWPPAAGGDGSYTYVWTPTPDLDDATSANPLAFPSGDAIYTLTVIDGNSCTDQDDIAITVNPHPVISVQPMDYVACDGGDAVFTVTATGTSLAYQWFESGTPVGSNSNELTLSSISAADDGSLVYVTVTDIGATPACAFNSAAATLFVTDAPTADAGTAVETCEDVPFTVSDATVTNSTGVSWTHDGSGSLTDASTLTPTYTPAVIDAGNLVILTLTNTGNGNCVNAVDTKTLNIATLLTANAGTDTIVCQGTPSINIETASVSGGNAVDVSWSLLSGGGSLTNETSLIPTYTPDPSDETGTISLQLTASDGSACSSVNDAVSLVINVKPVVDAGPNQVVCEGAEISLSDAALSGSASSVTWMDPSGLGAFSPNANTLNAFFIPDPDQIGTTVKLYITTNDPVGPCDTAIDSVLIQIDEAPKVNAGVYAPVCFGDTVFLNGSIGGSATSGTWSGGTGTYLYDGSLNPAYIPNANEQNTDIVLTLLTDDPSNSCLAASMQTSITVNSLPGTILFGLEASYQVDDESVALIGFPSGGVFSGTGIIGGMFYPVLADAGIHEITYTVTDDNTCENSDSEIVTVYPLPQDDVPQPGPFCRNDAVVLLPRTTNQNPDVIDWWEGTYVIPSMVEEKIEYAFDHTIAGVGNHTITYHFIDENGVKIERVKEITVNDVPVVQFTTLNNCQLDAISFVDSSYLEDAENMEDDIVSWEWAFGDGTVSAKQHPIKFFDAPDYYDVSLTLYSKYGCSSEKTEIIPVGGVPDADFSLNYGLAGNNTEFIGIINMVHPGEIDSIRWDFGDGVTAVGGPDLVNAQHIYDLDDTYMVSMIVESDLGCIDTARQSVNINELIVVHPEQPYKNDLENELLSLMDHGSLCDNESSWEWGSPSGEVINYAKSGSKVWMTNLNGHHGHNEHSYVNFPSFDLSLLQRPMLSIDIWSNAESRRDGLVMQYTLDGGITWAALVDENENIFMGQSQQIGLNWYNEKGLISRPGDIDFGSEELGNREGYGWTGIDSEWRTASYPLDSIRDLQQADGAISFRVVFASDDGNPEDSNYDGFAIDNFVIGERQRMVLFEHFDNLDSDNRKIDSLNYFAKQCALDMIPLQYHNDFPHEDDIYKNNSRVVENRRSIYNIDESPKSFLDGQMEYDYKESFVKMYQIVNRTLERPAFDIDISIDSVSQSSVEINVTLTAIEDFSEQVIANMMIIESMVDQLMNQQRGIDSLTSIVKDILITDNSFTSSWTTGESRNISVTYDLDKIFPDYDIYDNTKLGVVVFVQNDVNEGSREVYQAGYSELPALQKRDPITGLDEELNIKKFTEAIIYPNPVQNYFTVALKEELAEDVVWKFIDQRGLELLGGKFSAGETQFIIDTQSIKEGMYLFMVYGENEFSTIQKIVVRR